MFKKSIVLMLVLMPFQGHATWLTADLSTAGFDGNDVRLDVNSSGDAIAAWEEFNGINNHAQASIFSNESWNTTMLSSNPSEAIQVAINDTGNAVAVWEEFDGTYWVIQSALYSPVTGWASTQQLSLSISDSLDPQVGMNNSGTIIVVWEQDTGNGDVIQSIVNTGSWGSITPLSSLSADSRNPQVALSDFGNALVLWEEYDSILGIQTIQASEYSGTWATEHQISVLGEDSYEPEVAMNTLGDGMAVWTGYDGTTNVIHALSYSTTWSGVVDTLSASVLFMDSALGQIDLNDAKNAVAVWNQYDGFNHRIYSASFSFSSGVWSSSVPLSTAAVDADWTQQVALNNNDHAVAVWTETNGFMNQVKTARYTFSGGSWIDFFSISATNGDAINPAVKFNDAGHGFALWQRYDGIDYIIQASYGIGL